MSYSSDWILQINSTTDSTCPQYKMANYRYVLLAKFPSQKRLQATTLSFLQQFSLEQPTNNTATAPLMSLTQSWLKYSRGHVAQVSLNTGVFQQTGVTIPQQQRLQVNSDPKFWLGDLKAI